MAVSYASLLSMSAISSSGGFSCTRTTITACSFSSPRLQKFALASASAASSSFLSGSGTLSPSRLACPVRRGMDSCFFSIRAMGMEEPKPEVTQKVYLEINIPNQDEKRKIVIGLYGKDVPQTANRFRDLCNKVRGQSYQGSTFKKIESAIRGGTLQSGNEGSMISSSPKGIRRFSSFTEDKKGLDISPERGAVCMADHMNKIIGTEFFICIKEEPVWKGQHVVFGEVLTGMDVVDSIAALDSDKNAVIVDCGDQ